MDAKINILLPHIKAWNVTAMWGQYMTDTFASLKTILFGVDMKIGTKEAI